ncbi:MAG: hypothetical protein HKO92_08705, partial [Flavobacteriaceae bacterium]|nr:hypothetical protein [Flavobacteriaceae bacterium]
MMKKFTFFILLVTASFIFSCSNDNLDDNSQSNENLNFTVTESSNNFQLMRASADVPCTEVDLIAGQNMVAGNVTSEIIGDYIEIKFITNEGWNIDLTHLSLGNCDDQWVPTTGSGNPKVGKFEHTEPHSIGINEVVYQIGIEHLDLDLNTTPETDGKYCFAAHAEVSSTTGGGGETAWAEDFIDDEKTVRRTFDGNSWA